MMFRMKVEDLYRIGENTIFTGQLETQLKVIRNTSCVFEVDGERVGELQINGEVLTGRPYRDLWTTSHVNFTREDIGEHDVWLIAERVGS